MADGAVSKNHVSLLKERTTTPNKNNPIPADISAQWHPTKNGKWTPSDFSRSSNYEATWHCGKREECGCYHIWNSSISNRTKRGCPWCCCQKRCQHMMDMTHSLQAKYPEIAKQWHPTKNGNVSPNQITACSGDEYWWLCPKKCPQGCEHAYKMIVSNKVKGQGCPFTGCCASSKRFCIHTSLETTHPEIASYWDKEKNKNTCGNPLLPEDVTYGTNYMAHWKCPKKCPEGCCHAWEATVASTCRAKECDVCLFCSGQKICPHASLKYLYPAIASEWHPTKNIDENGRPITADHVFPMSGKSAWWLCPNKCPAGCVHEYEMIIANRTDKNQSCPFSGCCSTAPKKCCMHTSLQCLHPEIASEWHPTKNSTTPDAILPFSNESAWWVCNKDPSHGTWEAKISDRHETGCPKCSHYKSETETRHIAEEITGKMFPKKRGLFTNKRFEIDCYCDELKIGIEQQGAQHYRYVPHFHRKGPIDFEKQQERDQKKRDECLKLGIKLIEVPYYLKGVEKENYIRTELSRLNL
jgi:hypothetical protein